MTRSIARPAASVAGNALERPGRSDARVQVEREPERDLGSELGTVGAADAGQAACTQEDRVGRPACRQGRGRQVLTALQVGRAPAGASMNSRRNSPARPVAAASTLRALETTSGPIPSPAMTAILYVFIPGAQSRWNAYSGFEGSKSCGVNPASMTRSS